MPGRCRRNDDGCLCRCLGCCVKGCPQPTTKMRPRGACTSREARDERGAAAAGRCPIRNGIRNSRIASPRYIDATGEGLEELQHEVGIDLFVELSKHVWLRESFLRRRLTVLKERTSVQNHFDR